jgi:hypothetical protein
MQSTHATKRTRAHSDPGISTPGREDMEMQQRSTQAEASVQSAVDETATPDQQDVLTTPSIETGTLQESRTPRPTTIATLPDQGVQAKTSISHLLRRPRHQGQKRRERKSHRNCSSQRLRCKPTSLLPRKKMLRLARKTPPDSRGH